MKRFIYILIIIVSSKLCALNMENHFYAYGQNNIIDAYWNYIGEDNILGCNLLRSEEPYGQYTQINNELIIPVDNEFYYLDTEAIIDTLNYSYKIDYVFADSIYNYNRIYGSFKDISLNVLDENSIELNVILRNSYLYELRWFVDSSLYYSSFIVDSLTLILNLDQLVYYGEDYVFLFFQCINPANLISFHLTYNYLEHLISISGTNTNIIHPQLICIMQNFPNPFNPTTTISYILPNNIIDPKVEIFNIKGNIIRNLIINEHSSQYLDFVSWDGTDNKHNPVSSGVYLYRINSDNYSSEVRRMILIK